MFVCVKAAVPWCCYAVRHKNIISIKCESVFQSYSNYWCILWNKNVNVLCMFKLSMQIRWSLLDIPPIFLETSLTKKSESALVGKYLIITDRAHECIS